MRQTRATKMGVVCSLHPHGGLLVDGVWLHRRVISVETGAIGTVVGGGGVCKKHRRCYKVSVRWPNGKLTRVCSSSLRSTNHARSFTFDELDATDIALNGIDLLIDPQEQ